MPPHIECHYYIIFFCFNPLLFLRARLSTAKTILPLRNARAEHGRFSDKFPLRASCASRGPFCLIGNEVSYQTKKARPSPGRISPVPQGHASYMLLCTVFCQTTLQRSDHHRTASAMPLYLRSSPVCQPERGEPP